MYDADYPNGIQENCAVHGPDSSTWFPARCPDPLGAPCIVRKVDLGPDRPELESRPWDYHYCFPFRQMTLLSWASVSPSIK